MRIDREERKVFKDAKENIEMYEQVRESEMTDTITEIRVKIIDNILKLNSLGQMLLDVEEIRMMLDDILPKTAFKRLEKLLEKNSFMFPRR